MNFSLENTIDIWEGNIPNQNKTNDKEIQGDRDIVWIENVQQPTLEVFLPTERYATDKAVIICPGGGYEGLAYDLEGTDIAKWYNTKGITAFVLKYRLPNSKSIITKHKAPLQDVQRAIKYVRYHSEKWNIAKNKIGIMGFSAGGHLAASLGTHYTTETVTEDLINTTNARPDFMVLAYPVISMNSNHTHKGSRENLLGNEPNNDLVDFYSNELNVDKNTPPTFIVHCGDDDVVSVSNAILFYQALQKENIPAEMHIYPKGGHGFGLGIGKGNLQSWTDRLYEWLKELN